MEVGIRAFSARCASMSAKPCHAGFPDRLTRTCPPPKKNTCTPAQSKDHTRTHTHTHRYRTHTLSARAKNPASHINESNGPEKTIRLRLRIDSTSVPPRNRRYFSRWSSVSRQNSTCSVLPGRSAWSPHTAPRTTRGVLIRQRQDHPTVPKHTATHDLDIDLHPNTSETHHNTDLNIDLHAPQHVRRDEIAENAGAVVGGLCAMKNGAAAGAIKHL